MLDKLSACGGFSSTRGIANKGFSGLRSKATRINICCTLIGKKSAIPY